MKLNPVVLHVRPAEVMEDIDLTVLDERVRRLADWGAELYDTRLSDAPYVAVKVNLPTIGEDELARLKRTFIDLPRMRVFIWQRGAEVPLQAADVTAMEIASHSLPAHLKKAPTRPEE